MDFLVFSVSKNIFLYTKKHRFFSINWQVCLIFLDSFLVSVFQRQILSRFFCRYLHIFVLTFGGKFNNSSRKWQFLSTTLNFSSIFFENKPTLMFLLSLFTRHLCTCTQLFAFFSSDTTGVFETIDFFRVTRRAFLKHAIYRCKIDICFAACALLSFFFE